MYFLFIGESLGWQELILIGVVALIVLGPRRLPEVAKKIGKTMADFRKITNDFKETWEKEVNFDEEKQTFNSLLSENNLADENKLTKKIEPQEKLLTPQIKELSEEEIGNLFKNKELNGKVDLIKNTESTEKVEDKPQSEILPQSKRDWL